MAIDQRALKQALETSAMLREQDERNRNQPRPQKRGTTMTKSGAKVKRLSIASTRDQIDALYEELTEALDAVDVAARRESSLANADRNRIDANRFPAAAGE